MVILKICIFAIIGAFAITVVKEQNKEVSLILTVACSMGITFTIVEELSGIIENLISTIKNYGVNVSHISTVIKTVCIGYLAQVSIDLLEDMGAKSLANKIVLCAKIVIMSLSIPLIVEIVEIVGAIL